MGQLNLEVKGKIPERGLSAGSEGYLRVSRQTEPSKTDGGREDTKGMGWTKTMKSETVWCGRGVQKLQYHWKITCSAGAVRK